MTDYLEPYRQLVRSIRFAPQVGQHERFNRLVHQPLPLPSVHHDKTRQVTTTSTIKPDGGPTPDPSEHSAALVHAAVSKHTVLPVTYSILENIGDRISRLTASKPKQVRLPIVTPKIPEPDPNWIPPTPPPVIQHLVTDLQTPVETQQVSPIVEDELTVTQPAEIVDLPPDSTTLIESEKVAEPATEVVNLNQISTSEVETESITEENSPQVITDEVETESITEENSPQVITNEVEPESIIEENSPQVITDEVEPESIIEEPTTLDNSSDPIASENIADTSREVTDLNQGEPKPEELSVSSNEASELVQPTTPIVENEVTQPEEILVEKNEISLEQKPIEAAKFTEPELTAIDNGTATIVEAKTSNVEGKKLDKEKTKSPENPKITVICPECNSREVRKNGKQKNKQKYLCKDCGRQFVWSVSVEENVKQDEQLSEEAKATTEPVANKAKLAKKKPKNQPKGFGGSKNK